MKFLVPLGLIALIGIIALIIIYIIKPNYQKKTISSTYIWKLSLKRLKKHLPINKFRNILLFIAQILILSICAFLISKPVIDSKKEKEPNEKVLIIDASANMLAVDPTSSVIYLDPITLEEHRMTRFERAIEKAKEEVRNVLSNDNGRISVIIASNEPYILNAKTINENLDELIIPIKRANNSMLDAIIESLDNLKKPNDIKCSYGSASIKECMKQVESILNENMDSDVLFYTGTNYIDPGMVKIVDCKEETEYNVAITGGNAFINEKYVYSFSFDIASYEAPTEVEVTLSVRNANRTIDGETTVIDDMIISGIIIPENETRTITVDTYRYDEDAIWDNENKKIIYSEKEISEEELPKFAVTTYDEVTVSISSVSENKSFIDSLSLDNEYHFFGGYRPTLKVLYASSEANPFVAAMIASWRQAFQSKWNIISEELPRETEAKDIPVEGYDIYIYEHKQMPLTLPKDGVVIFLDPQKALPKESGLSLSRTNIADPDTSFVFDYGEMESHPLLNKVTPSNIEVTRYASVEDASNEYMTLMTVDARGVIQPVMLAKNTFDSKILMLAVDVNYSTLAMLSDFTNLFVNIMNYYLPFPMTKYEYNVSEKIEIESLSGDMYLYKRDSLGIPNLIDEILETKTEITLDVPGNYCLSQSLLSKAIMDTDFSIVAPSSESNISKLENVLENPVIERENKNNYLDLFLYLAIALVALYSIEWLLQSKDRM